MNKKGFTLIELLAVIVILAIITVIAVPKILDVIEKSKENSAEISARMYIDAINKSNSLNSIDDNVYQVIEDGKNIDVSNISNKIKLKGTYPTLGKVTIVNKKVTKAFLCIDDYLVDYNNANTTVSKGCSEIVSSVTIKDKENFKKVFYKDDVINLSVITDPENVKVNWESSNKNIATVTADGIVTMVGNGTVTITAYKRDAEDKIELRVLGPKIYVSTNGNDEIADGSKERPFANVSTAIENAKDDYTIFIEAGTYQLNKIHEDEYDELGIFDNSKKLTIYGENEKTILKYDGSTSTTRDASALRLANKQSILRNLVYVYKPAKSNDYSNSIFRWTYGKVENVFFIIDNSLKTASYDYNNNDSLSHTVENCTFYHTSGSVSSNYGKGSGIYTNIATNVNPVGQLTNVINENFTAEKENVQTIINNSKNNESFNNASAGVFFGKNAWK